MKWIKRLFLTLLVLIGLIIGGIAVFLVTFNPNAYKGQIEALVKEKTGRTLTLGGNIRLSVYPWLGLRLNDVSLSNPPGFGKAPFATVRKVSLYVELLPLLKRKLIVKQVAVDGLNLNLVTAADGKTNWQDLLVHSARAAGASPTMAQRAASSPATAAAGAPFALSVAGIQVSQARIDWVDRKTGQRIVLAPLNLSVGQIGEGRTAPLRLSFHMENANPPLGVDGRLAADLSVDLARSRYALSHLVLTLKAQSERLPQGEVQAALKGDLAMDAAGSGALRFAPFSLSLQHTRVDGTLSAQDFASPRIRFKLHSPAIDLGHLLALSNALFPPPAAAPVSHTTTVNAVPPGDTPIDLPVALLRRLRVDGDIRIDRLSFEKMQLSQVQAVLSGSGGLLKMAPISAMLYGGTLNGDAALDVRGALPRYALNAALQQVQLADLMKDYAGQAYLTGLARLDAHLTTQGQTVDGLTRGLNGSLALSVSKGSFQHSRLASQIQALLALLHKTPAAGQNAVSFISLTATAAIHSGILSSNDLLLNAVLFKASGSGTVNLPARRVDYVLRFEKAQGKGAVIPLKIHGPFDALKYQIELGAMIQNEAKQKLRQKLDQERGKLENRLKNELMKNLNKLF